MDTDEGQRTSARLLEEAQRLSQEAHTYTTIEETQKVGTGGSDVAISDILSAQDPRELAMSPLGEHRPVPTQMSAGLPRGVLSALLTSIQNSEQDMESDWKKSIDPGIVEDPQGPLTSIILPLMMEQHQD